MPAHFSRCFALILLGSSLWLTSRAGAGTIPLLAEKTPAVAPAEKSAELTPASIATKREQVRREIVDARARLAKLPDGKLDENALWLTQETALLERIDSVYLEQEATLQHATDLAKEQAEVQQLSLNLSSPETTFKPPYNLKLLNQLYGERDYVERAGDTLKADIDNVTGELGDAREQLDAKNRARRTAREAVQTGSDLVKAQGQLRLLELETRLAQETVWLKEKSLQTLKLQQSLLAPKKELIGPRLKWLRKNVAVAEADVKAESAKREKRAAEIDAAMSAAKEDADKASRLVIAVERRSGAEPNPAELESRRADRQTANYTLSVLAAQRERLVEMTELGEQRRKVLANTTTSQEMRQWAEENETELDRVEKERRQQISDFGKSRRELQALQQKLSGAENEARPAAWENERRQRVAAWIALNERELREIGDLRTERQRLKEEIGERVNLFSIRDATASTRENILAAWNYELFSVKDQPVRVKTIFGVILLVWLGHWLARRASDLIGSAVFHRMGMNVGRRAAWQTLSFYTFFLIVLLVAFNLFHLSFTQFSVMSGALAVGLGFGSQNLISNFISGIILLIERPVNQGDVIEIDGRQVTVERLGPRSTIVRSADNTHIVVPNSRLLEQPVVNWTLSDDVVRKRIRLGVAYDSPTRKVAELLDGVVKGIENVRKEPAPVVKFADFGENSLVFEIYFWVALCDPHDAEDELRHRIAETFAKEKIIMAFPQRDVHLETTKPLRVELLNPVPASPAAASNDQLGEGAGGKSSDQSGKIKSEPSG
ncbi:mechanosensitive ion channel domain-containing protein [Oleiharenicola lentus]|uniref:mechanosensitive ion channel domain-containing protein n=1 Tax=Oleiharenicola lentus TaxID=2508720 RepID=UPI003F680895